MSEFKVTSSPHIASPVTSRSIMGSVALALVPTVVASTFIFGIRSLLVTFVTTAACVLVEMLCCKLLKKPNTAGDLSAVVTGLLLAFNLPANIPIWECVVGAVVAIAVVKQLFGGLGCNFVNPALAGRVVMALSFAGDMTNYAYPTRVADALSSATPLAMIESGSKSVGLWALLTGNHGGMLGETCSLALLAGGIFLMAIKVIKPIIPLSYIASTFVFSALFGCEAPFLSLFAGGLFLGAFFMATDYVTSPYSDFGKLVFGLGCGLLTAIIRMYAYSAEGVSYAILLMNLVVPYINDFTRRKPFGLGGKKA